jgi:hypothetical protein
LPLVSPDEVSEMTWLGSMLIAVIVVVVVAGGSNLDAMLAAIC